MYQSGKNLISLVCFVLIFGGISQAITVTDVRDATNPGPGSTYFLPANKDPELPYYFRLGNQDWGWSHTIDSAGYITSSNIVSATLAIEAYDIDAIENDEIKAEGVSLGYLTSNKSSQWNTTTFTLGADAIAKLVDGKLDVTIDIDTTTSPTHYAVTIRKSTLTVVYNKYGGGTGDPNTPYLITTPDNLNNIGISSHQADWSKYFVLTKDVNLAAYTGTQFNLIGDGKNDPNAKGFSGVFDGKGYKISSFKYKSTDMNDVGLFRNVLLTGQIKNLKMDNADVNIPIGGKGNYIGTLVGWNKGTISNCNLAGRVAGATNVGGLVGINEGTIGMCSFSGAVSGKNSGTENNVGGLVGYNFAVIMDSYSLASVSGGDCIGGLVGQNTLSFANPIRRCYSAGKVTGQTNVGGLVGFASVRQFTATAFWDTQTSGQSASFIGTGKTTAQMKTKSTFTDAGWDFVAVWDIIAGQSYPFLR
jgi:hypothetical protein